MLSLLLRQLERQRHPGIQSIGHDFPNISGGPALLQLEIVQSLNG
jgi:hypothetical protein